MTLAHTGWPKPDGQRTPHGWSRGVGTPGGRGGWAGRATRGTSEAEEILAGAVGWWDASRYYPGERWLRNLGQGGPDLDMRFGSNVRPNSNDPLYLAPEQRGYVYMPGVAGNTLSASGVAPNTTDLDIRLYLTGAWTNNSIPLIRRNVTGTGNGYVWSLETINVQGIFTINVYNAAGTLYQFYSNNPRSTFPFSGDYDSPVWVRATLDIDNGAGKMDGKWYYSFDGTTWVDFSSGWNGTQPNAGALYTHTSADNIIIGSFPGKLYDAEIRDGIGGTLVLDIDCDVLISGSQATFTAETGQTVTVSRATAGRKTVVMPSSSRPLFLFGGDDYLDCTKRQNDGGRGSANLYAPWLTHVEPSLSLLDLDPTTSLTVLAIYRDWQPATQQAFLAKYEPLQNQVGWALAINAGKPNVVVSGSGAVAVANQTAGALVAHYGIFDRTLRKVAVRSERVTAEAPWTGRSDASAPGCALYAGLFGGWSAYADMEFVAAAVFRRVLNPRECDCIADYYGAS